MKALIIEDDQLTIENVKWTFKFHWPDIEVISTARGAEGAGLVEMESPDVVILGLDLPDMDGMMVLQEIRRFSDVPVVILSGRDETTDIIKGLESGADDYVTKPYSPGVLLARADTVLRRCTKLQSIKGDELLTYGKLIINPASHEVVLNNKSIRLTGTEWKLLCCLARNAGRVIPYAELSVKAWGVEYNGDARIIRTCIWRLRNKLCDDNGIPGMIIGERSIGYRFVTPK